jgi:hypothetical protein
VVKRYLQPLVPVLPNGTYGIAHPQLKKQLGGGVARVVLTDEQYAPLRRKWELYGAAHNDDVWKVMTKVKVLKIDTLYRCFEHDSKGKVTRVSQQSWCWFGKDTVAQIRCFFAKKTSSLVKYPLLAELHLYPVQRHGDQVATRSLQHSTTHHAFVHELGELVALFENYVVETGKNRVTFYGGFGTQAPDPGHIVSNRGGPLTPVTTDPADGDPLQFPLAVLPR